MAARPDSFPLPIPTPPPFKHADKMERAETPVREAFLSPQQTPQGSPSKNQHPPGAFDLPHVFDNAMRLLPTMGTPGKAKPGSPTSPNKTAYYDDVAQDAGNPPGSPIRRSNNENTPPGSRIPVAKETGFMTQAAQSRQEPYRTREPEQQSTRYYPGPRGLSQEDLEKARKPSVKRLANVTQLCE